MFTTDPLVEVTFELPGTIPATTVALAGEFNSWCTDTHVLERAEDGSRYFIVVPLEGGKAYRYRYLIDGERWENDWRADRYVPNEHGGDDSVVDVPQATTRASELGDGPTQEASTDAV